MPEMPELKPFVPIAPTFPDLPGEIPWPPDFDFGDGLSPWYNGNDGRPYCYNDFASRLMRLLAAVSAHRAALGLRPMYPPFDLRFMVATPTIVNIAALWLVVAWNTHVDAAGGGGEQPPDTWPRWKFRAAVSLFARVDQNVYGSKLALIPNGIWAVGSRHTAISFVAETTGGDSKTTFDVRATNSLQAVVSHDPAPYYDRWCVVQHFPPAIGDARDYFDIAAREMTLDSELTGSGEAETKTYTKDGAALSSYTGTGNSESGAPYAEIILSSTAPAGSYATLKMTASTFCTGLVQDPRDSADWPPTMTASLSSGAGSWDIGDVIISEFGVYYVDADENPVELPAVPFAPISTLTLAALECPRMLAWLGSVENVLWPHLRS